MRFRFNVLLNGFVLVSVAVQSATAEALAHAEILDGRGTKLGDADVTSTDRGFTIAVKTLNLSRGEYGTRIHPVGKCKEHVFTSEGGHLIPTSTHLNASSPGDPQPNLGDLSHLVVGNDGVGILNCVVADVTLGDGAKSLIYEGGKSTVIHSKPDVHASDPSGYFGDRIAQA